MTLHIFTLFTQQIKAQMRNKKYLAIDNIDVRELLDDLSIPYDERGKNISFGWIGVQCPFCDDASNHLGINIQRKTISCFKCGKSGTIINYLSQELNSFNKAMQLIEDSIPRELRRLDQEMEQSSVQRVEIPKYTNKGLSNRHKVYLKKRRFNPDILEEKLYLQSCEPVGDWANRIIVPFVKNYRLVTFVGIDIADKSPMRYKNNDDDKSIIPVKHTLYGTEFSNGFSCIIVEGFFDSLRMGPGAIPMWGVKFTEEQVRQIVKNFSEAKIVGDGDKAGWEFNRRLSSALSPYMKVRYFDLEEGIDPDDLTKEEVKHIRNA